MFLSDSPAHEIDDSCVLLSEVGGMSVGVECVLAPLNYVSGVVWELSEWYETLDISLFRIVDIFVEDPRCVIDTTGARWGRGGGKTLKGPLVGNPLCWSWVNLRHGWWRPSSMDVALAWWLGGVGVGVGVLLGVSRWCFCLASPHFGITWERHG